MSIAYIAVYETSDLDRTARRVVRVCPDAAGEHVLHRRTRREDRRDRCRSAIALVRCWPDRSVGGGWRGRRRDAELCRPILRTARTRSSPRRKERTRSIARTADGRRFVPGAAGGDDRHER